MKSAKNRNRGKFTFANINLLGKCNANCFFCLGKDIEKELANKNQLNIHYSEWLNFETFLTRCNDEGITKLYLTGQTADGLQYKYLDEIIDYLQGNGFSVGVRTNGYLAKSKISSIKKMRDEIGYSIHSLVPEVNKVIMGRIDIPDWEYIIPQSGDNVRVAIVLTRYNVSEFYDICKYLSKFDNVKYIQVRRVSTDTRQDYLNEDIQAFENFYNSFSMNHDKVSEYHLAPQFSLYGKGVTFWRTVETNVNGLNYFTDGLCSDEYFIVEGYLNQLNKGV